MNSRLGFLLLVALCCIWQNATAAVDLDALRECGNLHHLEFRQIPNAVAEFSSSNCMLKCAIGDKVLSEDALNEGYQCPGNSNGVCRHGQCIVNPLEALRECSNLHHVDFRSKNSTGTTFTESHCFLNCVIDGQTVSANAINEGFPCPDNANRICRHGRCEVNNATLPVDKIILEKVDATIVSATFIDRSLTHLTATLCIVHEKSKVCTQQCKSDMSNTKQTNRPIWNKHCLLKGPFASGDVFVINIVHENAFSNHRANSAGVVKLNIMQYFEEQHANHSGLDYFTVKPQLPMYLNGASSKGMINLEFLFKFNKTV